MAVSALNVSFTSWESQYRNRANIVLLNSNGYWIRTPSDIINRPDYYHLVGSLVNSSQQTTVHNKTDGVTLTGILTLICILIPNICILHLQRYPHSQYHPSVYFGNRWGSEDFLGVQSWRQPLVWKGPTAFDLCSLPASSYLPKKNYTLRLKRQIQYNMGVTKKDLKTMRTFMSWLCLNS